MGQGSKNCKVPSHQLLKDRAKNRVEDLQLMLKELQLAREECRAGDVATLEEQVNQILQDWKAELDQPTPASSLLENSLGSFSSELDRLLRQFEEEDDATSRLTATNHGDATDKFAAAESALHAGVYDANHTSQPQEFQAFENHMQQQQHEFQVFEHFNGAAPGLQGTLINSIEASNVHNLLNSNLEITAQLEYHHLNAHQTSNEIFLSPSDIEQWEVDGISDFSDLWSNINPPPSAFLGPKCALWDCARPAQLSEGCKNYCSTFHAELAVKECPPGTAPVLRPGGIGLKDGPLFAALRAKIEGNDVGIPECEGAATAKSPWNAPDLFDIFILEGERLREWLFFDKPRRAFEKGNRKQRSLPDYEGRGWHESRKQIMKEFGGQKRSYYADPQPQKNYEWHLFEYEIDNCGTYALYRLELKAAAEKKKSPKTKGSIDLLVDLQKRMGRLTAEADTEEKCSGKAKVKVNLRSDLGNVFVASKSSIGQDGRPEWQFSEDRKS